MAYNPDIKLTFSISLTFYHVSSKRFFGSTFIGCEHKYNTKTDNERDSILLNELVYFSPKYDRGDEQLIIVELIATEYNRKSGTKEGVYGCGWTLLRIPTIKGAERRKNVIQEYRSVPLNLGSPKIILRMTPQEVRAICDSPDSSGFQIQYELWVCSPDLGATLRSNALIKDDELIGALEPIPGLRMTKVALQKGRDFTGHCIGGVSAPKDFHGLKYWKLTPVSELHMASQIPIHLSALRLIFPNGRARFETSIINGALKTHPYIEVPRDQVKFLGITFRKNAKSKLIRVTKASITRRALRLGVHNGHSLIGGDDDKWSEIELHPSDSDHNLLLGNKNSYSLPIFFDHSLCALVILLKYNLELSVSAQDRSTLRTYSKKLHRVAQINVTAGYQIILPFQTAGATHVSLDSLSVHLPLLHDTNCAEFSDSPIHTPSSLKDAILDLQVNWRLGKSNTSKSAPKAIEFIASDIDTHVSSLTIPSMRWKELEGKRPSKLDSKELPTWDSEKLKPSVQFKNLAVPVSTQTGGSLSSETSKIPIHPEYDPVNRRQSCSQLYDENKTVTKQVKIIVAQRLVKSEPALMSIVKKIAGYLLVKDEHLLSHFGFQTVDEKIRSEELYTKDFLTSNDCVDAFYMIIMQFLQWYRNIKKQSFLLLHVHK